MQNTFIVSNMGYDIAKHSKHDMVQAHAYTNYYLHWVTEYFTNYFKNIAAPVIGICDITFEDYI